MDGSRPRLKIVFVDSGSLCRISRLRRNPSRTIRQSRDLSVATGNETISGASDEEVHSLNCLAIDHESDQDYHDDKARSAKRLRRRQKLRCPRKQKRHGRLAAADRDLIIKAQQGQPECRAPNNKVPTVAGEDATNLATSRSESIEWRQATVVQTELKTIFQQPLARPGQPKWTGKSVSSKVDGDAVPGGRG